MQRRSGQTEHASRRRGFTLLEVLIVVGLVSLLIGVAMVAGNAVRQSRRLATAEQQMAMVSQAIDQYASFWPRWEAGGGRVVAEKGWPDFIGWRLFTPTADGGPYYSIDPMNNHTTFDLVDVVASGVERHPPGFDYVGVGNVLGANICLAYSLTAELGEGPYLPADDDALIKDVTDPVLMDGFNKTGDAGTVMANPMLPWHVAAGSSGSRHAQVLVDPWGTPYRYFWVYRDSAAYRGFLPVWSADFSDPDNLPPTAIGFVLESAGPNRKFGNVWQVSVDVDDYDIRESADNLVVTP